MFFMSQIVGLLVIWVLVIAFSTRCHSRILFYDPYNAFAYDPSKPNENYGTIPNYGYGFSEVLKLGLPFPVAPKRFEGMAVLANPEDGCQSIASPPNTTGINRTGKWIALMKTGNCNFTVKARNAQNANYQMVLIYGVENFADDEVDIKMHKSSNKSDIKIQASSASDPDNKTAITLHFDKENITVPHAITVQLQSPKSSNNSDIKIYAVITNSLFGNRIKNNATYHDKIILGIVNDDNDPVYCHRYEDGITQCVGFNSNRLVPIPDTWSV